MSARKREMASQYYSPNDESIFPARLERLFPSHVPFLLQGLEGKAYAREVAG
jgi:hypothetical protein